VARALGRRLGWPLIDKDDVTDVLDGQTPLAGALAHEITQRVAWRHLRQGLSVICDSPLPARTYAGLRQIAIEERAPLVVIECRCGDEALWRDRIEARQTLALPDHHTVTWDRVQAFLAQPGVNFPLSSPHLVVDTARPLATLIEDIVAWLGQPAPDFAAASQPMGLPGSGEQ
jgi:predicted kinase